jgi:hypothetical protein
MSTPTTAMSTTSRDDEENAKLVENRTNVVKSNVIVKEITLSNWIDIVWLSCGNLLTLWILKSDNIRVYLACQFIYYFYCTNTLIKSRIQKVKQTPTQTQKHKQQKSSTATIHLYHHIFALLLLFYTIFYADDTFKVSTSEKLVYFQICVAFILFAKQSSSLVIFGLAISLWFEIRIRQHFHFIITNLLLYYYWSSSATIVTTTTTTLATSTSHLQFLFETLLNVTTLGFSVYYFIDFLIKASLYGDSRQVILWLLTRSQGLQFKWITNLDEARRILRSSDNKGHCIEEWIAGPAWLPILSLESTNGAEWKQLKHNFIMFQRQLPPVSKLQEAVRHCTAKIIKCKQEQQQEQQQQQQHQEMKVVDLTDSIIKNNNNNNNIDANDIVEIVILSMIEWIFDVKVDNLKSNEWSFVCGNCKFQD